MCYYHAFYHSDIKVLPLMCLFPLFPPLPSRCRNGNYSCGITVPPHFPVKFTQLELNTTGMSVMVLCSWTSGSSCLEQIESPESASATFSTGFSHTWDMPVGVFQNSSYTFRIMPLSEVQTYDCTQDSSLIGMDYMEYSFNFDRDLSLCPA
ncbi:myelin regulatory factor-like protein [Diadema antillarum]|uniref:myelin regulatory factor-like protein n=1 Tax=Diadema antillarum TaxID=105358 RepID=UPI003A86ACFA